MFLTYKILLQEKKIYILMGQQQQTLLFKFTITVKNKMKGGPKLNFVMGLSRFQFCETDKQKTCASIFNFIKTASNLLISYHSL